MYSWKVTRIACILLLLLPIVHLAYLMARDTRETLNNSPEAWSREINDYASVDTATALPKNPIVVVGGRRVKLWDNLQELLAEHGYKGPLLVMQGYGGLLPAAEAAERSVGMVECGPVAGVIVAESIGKDDRDGLNLHSGL